MYPPISPSPSSSVSVSDLEVDAKADPDAGVDVNGVAWLAAVHHRAAGANSYGSIAAHRRCAVCLSNRLSWRDVDEPLQLSHLATGLRVQVSDVLG